MLLRTVRWLAVSAMLAMALVWTSAAIARGKQDVKVTLKAPTSVHANKAWKFSGTVSGADGPVTTGSLQAIITDARGHGKITMAVALKPDGTFTGRHHSVNVLDPGMKLKLKVVYAGDATHSKASSKTVKIRVTR